jgi:hypothetical protein
MVPTLLGVATAVLFILAAVFLGLFLNCQGHACPDCNRPRMAETDEEKP